MGVDVGSSPSEEDRRKVDANRPKEQLMSSISEATYKEALEEILSPL